MSGYKAIRETIQTEFKETPKLYKEKLALWHSEPTVTRVDYPTNLPRARELGYKAKSGILVVRVRVRSGRSKRVMPGGGRKPSKSGRFFSRVGSSQSIAEGRAAQKFSNCEVLNSYYIGTNGYEKFYDVILLDRSNPVLRADPRYAAMLGQRNRVFRGLTSSGRKHRGLSGKGFGTGALRPSRRSVERSGN
jgi:large subunit ribosomal protein L15e